MSYYYDLHVHTKEVSPCGWLSIEEMAGLYKKSGYQGFCLTNHFHREFLMKTEGMSWEERANRFLMPWKKGKNLCRDNFDVILGMEIRFLDDPNDYLLYGVPEDLFKNEGENWLSMNLESFYHRYQKQFLIIQAHPSRTGSSQPASVNLLHGMEAVNTSPRHDNGNEETQTIIKEHPALLATAGSDSHRTEDVGLAGILTEKRIRTGDELAELLKTKAYLLMEKGVLLTPEFQKAGTQ